MATTTRTWVGFGDLAVGERFRFSYGALALPEPLRVSAPMVKVSPRRYRDLADGRVWATGAATAVTVDTPPELRVS